MSGYSRQYRALLLTAVLAVAGCTGGGEGDMVRVHVPAGATFTEATDSLAAKGILRLPPVFFRVYARVTGADDRIQPGTYGFRPGAGWGGILDDLRHGRILTRDIVIPEGWTMRRIAARFEAELGASPPVVRALLEDDGAVDRFDVPGPTLEGYLYPATYTFPVDATLDMIVQRMVDRYRSVWTAERQARADSMDMTQREVVTLASIIETEARQRDELPVISAVYHNRLRIGYPLQADPTVQYALAERQDRLLYSHIDQVADHPYNTYTHQGLPPGPIASPSAPAIDAAMRPADVDYLYFVARPDGSHIFTRSLREHNRAKARVRSMGSSADDAER